MVIEGKKMYNVKRIIKFGKKTYWIDSKDDVIEAIKDAYKDGHSIEEIAKVFHIPKSRVIQYLESC